MPRKRSLYAVATFRTTTDALRLESAARGAGLPGRLIPVPGEISAGCGLAWRMSRPEREALERLAADCGIELEGIHELYL